MAEEPWARQPRESGPAHAAFRTYLELGPERSLARVAQELSKSLPLIKRWSSAWGWQVRLRAWEAHALRVADEAHLAGKARRAKIQAESTRLALDSQAGIALEFMRRVEANPDLLARMDFETLRRRAEASNRASIA